MKVLYIGGTGTISSACVAESVRQGQDVHVLNPESMHRALADATYDCVLDFLGYNAKDAAATVDLLADRTGQYIYISSASIYHKPVRKVPFVESTPRHNPHLPYARDKIAAEDVLRQAYEDRDFPVTIVRPSHTDDDARPPMPGDWTAWDRVVRGDELVVPGDGTSLWTITHARDFAVGLAGLIGNWQAIGEDFHITSDEVLSWNEIYGIVARVAGTRARL